jgi:ferrous iron transport protein A
MEVDVRKLKKHNIIENLLISFGIKKEQAHREASTLEHILSNDVEKELDYINRNSDFIQLTSLKEGDEGEIAVIRAGRAATQRLNEMGLVPETRIKVLRKGALKGPIEIGVRNSRLVIGAGLASKIYVRII